MTGALGQLLDSDARQQDQGRRLNGEEGVAQVLQQIAAEAAGVLAGGDATGDGLQRPGGVAFGQGIYELGQGAGVVFASAGGGQLLEGGLGVAGGATSPPHRQTDGIRGEAEAGVLVDGAEKLCQQVAAKEAELEVLSAG